MRTNNGVLIEALEMRMFMLAVAHKRGWNVASLRPNWTLKTINHSPKKGLHHFARAIAKAINVTIQKTLPECEGQLANSELFQPTRIDHKR